MHSHMEQFMNNHVQHGSPPVVPVGKELFNDATIIALAVW
jgi:hypothetical protein